MYVERWSHEEIETYRNNTNLLFSRANELRSKVIHEWFIQIINRIRSIMNEKN